jgi:hypothetical protein
MSNDMNIDQVAENQASPEVTINDATAQLAAAFSDDYAVDLTSGNVVLTSAQYRSALRFLASGVATTGRTVTLPAVKRTVILASAAANTDNISVIKGSTTVTVVPGSVVLVHTDGTSNGLDVTVVGSLSGAPYDLAFFIPGTTVNSQLLLQYIFDRRVTFLANLAGSKYVNGTNPTSTATITFKKNGSLIGATSTASISTGGAATFTVDAVTFDAGDKLTVLAQASADTTLADISFTLKGVRT